jgi:hypothetical protein
MVGETMKLIGTVGQETFYLCANGQLMQRTRFSSGNRSKIRSAGQYATTYTEVTAREYLGIQ